MPRAGDAQANTNTLTALSICPPTKLGTRWHLEQPGIR